jgi:hypothetical protein
MFCYTDDVLSLNNSNIDDFVGRICPIETEITDTTDTDKSDLCLGLSLEIHSEGQLRAKLNDIVKKIYNRKHKVSSCWNVATCKWKICSGVRVTRSLVL